MDGAACVFCLQPTTAPTGNPGSAEGAIPRSPYATSQAPQSANRANRVVRAAGASFPATGTAFRVIAAPGIAGRFGFWRDYMCGIAGLILSSGAAPPDPAVLTKLINALHHRGPDGSGHAVMGRVALVHNRLAIIDLVTGDQPFFSGSATLVANGEIYNYRELRAAMPGVAFSTN